MIVFQKSYKFARIKTGCSAVGSALRSGRRGRRFESCHPDKTQYNSFIICSLDSRRTILPGEIRDSVSSLSFFILVLIIYRALNKMTMQSKSKNSSFKEIYSYTPPKLYEGKEWYVGFRAFDPALGDMHFKKIKLNYIKSIYEKRKFAAGLIKRLNIKLENGWNPWIENENNKAYQTFDDVCLHYTNYIKKLHIDGVYRKDTITSNLSYIKNIQVFNNQYSNRITYIYQFDKIFIDDLLDYIYIDRNSSPQTRNNYLGFVRVFSTFLVQHRYLKNKPTEGIPMISKRKIKKERIIIQEADMLKLKEYLSKKNKHYLLACYILHYCFIRPKEMSLLKIQDISLKNQTILINSDISKNRTSGIITLPIKVIHLMVELNIFDYPGNYYFFSKNFMPGFEPKSEKQFRDYWSNHVRKDLKFPVSYKFYSLKDTGITNMLRKMDKISVRDQARHSSILTTDIYTPHDIQGANEWIKKHDGVF